jgi:hypothetical protein
LLLLSTGIYCNEYAMFPSENGNRRNIFSFFWKMNDIFYMYGRKGRTDLMIGDILIDLWDFIAHDFWWSCYAVRNLWIQTKKWDSNSN